MGPLPVLQPGRGGRTADSDWYTQSGRSLSDGVMWSELMDALQDVKDKYVGDEEYCVSFDDYVSVEESLIQPCLDPVVPYYLVDQILLTMDFIMLANEDFHKRVPGFEDRHTCNLLLLFFACPLVRWSTRPGKWWPLFVARSFPEIAPPVCVRFLIEGAVSNHQWHGVYCEILLGFAESSIDLERAQFARLVGSVFLENKSLEIALSRALLGTNGITAQLLWKKLVDIIGWHWMLPIGAVALPRLEYAQNNSWKIVEMVYGAANVESVDILCHCVAKDMTVIWYLKHDQTHAHYIIDTEQICVEVVQARTNTVTLTSSDSDIPIGWDLNAKTHKVIPAETGICLTFTSQDEIESFCLQMSAARQPMCKISEAVLMIGDIDTSDIRKRHDSSLATQISNSSQVRTVVDDSQWSPCQLQHKPFHNQFEQSYRNSQSSLQFQSSPHLQIPSMSQKCVHPLSQCHSTVANTESQTLLAFQCKRQRHHLGSPPHSINQQSQREVSLDSCCHDLCADKMTSCACSTANTTFTRSQALPRHVPMADIRQLKHSFDAQLDVLRDIYHTDMNMILSYDDRQKYG